MSSLTTPTNTETYSVQEYHAVLQRLVKQRAVDIDLNLPKEEDCTLQHLQNIVETIFNGRLDAMVYQVAHKEILKNEELLTQSKLLLKKLSPFQVMNFPQVILYKTLPCPRGDSCKNKPREIAPSNQYKDEELECPFFHHEKDRRRVPITRKVEDEFIYKANYDKSKCDPFPDKFSKNYFESMFHPIYYRLFQCKRSHCENSFFCPFFHTKDEKTTWDETFLIYIRKSRDVYTKEKKDKKELSPKISSLNVSNDFIPRYDFLAAERKFSPEAQRTPNADKLSTRSSTNSSPSSSHNDIFDEFTCFQSPQPSYQKNARSPPGLGTPNPFSNYLGCNYSRNFLEETPVQERQSSNGQVNPISQFFNLNMVQNINNVRLNH